MNVIENIKFLKRRLLPSKYGWFGDYPDWQKALQESQGYDDKLILDKVKTATLKVKSGEAVYERDSVLFDKIEYSWPLLSSILWQAARKKGQISVVDFGGSLGSTYFQNKLFLDGLEKVEWSIIEQPKFVDSGRSMIADDVLRFFYSIEDCIAERGFPDILIIACTLPYLEKPYEFLDQIMSFKIPYVVIDNTPFNYENRDRLTIQKINPLIYAASYPCWFLNYEHIKKALTKEYSVMYEYQNELFIYLDGYKVYYRGLTAAVKYRS